MNTNRLATMVTLVLVALLLAGCLKGRSAGTMLDDQNTEFRVINAIYGDPDIDANSHIKVEVHEAIVLLLGETDTPARRERAGELAAAVPNVDRVVNEIQVGDSAGLAGRSHNSWLTTKVNTALRFDDSLKLVDTSRVKVISADRNVYLMGLVQSKDADAIVEVVRNVGGVEKVVKVFKYTD
jgi:osmotically-inducible protein OsmY